MAPLGRLFTVCNRGRESVASLRDETARLASEVLATIDGSENGVHQRTLNRLTTFIASFRTLNFAGDQQLEQTLERFRSDLDAFVDQDPSPRG